MRELSCPGRWMAVALLMAAACNRLGDLTKGGDFTGEAKRRFSSDFSCPADRIAVTARPDLSAYDMQVGPTAPPREIASDPGRLAEWKRHQQTVADGYSSESVWLAQGCGHKVFYVCTVATGTREQQVDVCTTANHPPK